jgi:hypothetical protein
VHDVRSGKGVEVAGPIPREDAGVKGGGALNHGFRKFSRVGDHRYQSRILLNPARSSRRPGGSPN